MAIDKRARTKGRKSKRRFAMLPLSVLEHVAVTTLPHATFRVLVLMAGQFNGHNNGALGLTAGQVADAGIGSQHTLYAALRDLQARGLIEQTFPASRVPPRPTMWALTWNPLDNTDYSNGTRIASNKYREWRPRDAA